MNSRPSFFLPSKIAQEDTAFGFSLHPHPANRPPLAGFARRESSSERVTKLVDRHSAGPDADEMPTCRYLPFLDECIGDLALIENWQGGNRPQSHARDAGYTDKWFGSRRCND